MKKTVIIIITILGIIIFGSYVFLDSIFPMVDTIVFSDTEQITSITLAYNNDCSLEVEETDIIDILNYLSDAKPTRTMSVNDYPTVKSYYSISVDTTSRQYRYFLYVENSQVYIEIPYDGIYKSNQQFLGFIEEYFKN